jgi:hypothetical protein
VLDPPVELIRVGERRFRKDHRELVAADPAGDVGTAHDGPHALGRLGEHRIPGEVADPVVDLLEVVEVEDDQRQPPLVPMGARDLPRQRLMEVAAVVEARKRVEVGELPGFAEAASVLDRRHGPYGERLELANVVVLERVVRRPREDREVAARAVAMRAFRLATTSATRSSAEESPRRRTKSRIRSRTTSTPSPAEIPISTFVVIAAERPVGLNVP